MKLSNSLILAATALASTSAFSPVSLPQRAAFASTRVAMSEDVVASSAMPVASPYERIGIEESELAIGIDASEFLQWIGT